MGFSISDPSWIQADSSNLRRFQFPISSNTKLSSGPILHIAVAPHLCINAGVLQIIVRVTWTPENYLVAQKHRSMSRPTRCPNCSAANALEALGYYERWLSGTNGKDMRLVIRRFRCRECGRTASLLPDFAQPYRLIRNAAIEQYFSVGEPNDALRNRTLLRFYWQRFTRWLPHLKRAVGSTLGRSPPASQPERWWVFLMEVAGDLARATRQLAKDVRVTIFGKYRCHQPRSA